MPLCIWTECSDGHLPEVHDTRLVERNRKFASDRRRRVAVVTENDRAEDFATRALHSTPAPVPKVSEQLYGPKSYGEFSLQHRLATRFGGTRLEASLAADVDSRPAVPWAKLPRQTDGAILNRQGGTDLLEESAGLQQPCVQEVPNERALPKPPVRLHVRTCTGVPNSAPGEDHDAPSNGSQGKLRQGAAYP